MPNSHAAQPEVDLVRLYLNDIGKHALLAKDDEARLAQAIEAGRAARSVSALTEGITPARRRELSRLSRDGDLAAETFVKANLRLVVSIARRYQAAELPLLDLVQDGNLGLIHAVEKFDWRRGFKFSTYASWWIRQAIARGIANTGRTIRLPVHAGDLLAQVTMARGRLEGKLGRRPTIVELAGDLELREEKVIEVLRHAGVPLSLSEPLGESGDAELGDLVEDPIRGLSLRCRRRGPAAGRGQQDAPPPRGPGAGDPTAALRPRPLCALHPRPDRRAFQPVPGADPPDRRPGFVQAAPGLDRPRPPRAAHRLRHTGRSSATMESVRREVGNHPVSALLPAN